MVQGSEPSCLDCHLAYGKCINQQCICNDGWLGSDCRTFANKLLSNKTLHQIIEPRAWVYLYFPFDGKTFNKVSKYCQEFTKMY